MEIGKKLIGGVCVCVFCLDGREVKIGGGTWCTSCKYPMYSWEIGSGAWERGQDDKRDLGVMRHVESIWQCTWFWKLN